MPRSRLPNLGPNGEGWVVGQLVLLLATAVLGALALPRAFDAHGLLRSVQIVAGAMLILLGGSLAILSVAELGNSLEARPRPKADGHLVTTGLYAAIRHPIYAGLIDLAIGWAGVSGSLPAFSAALLLAIWLDLKSRREEAWLGERYPEYAAYRLRTSRFVPRIY